MTTPLLQNYLLANRRRSALSQDEVAFLLGVRSGAKVCRHERFTREPSLVTALAYEVIYQKPVSELFNGLYQSTEQEVAARAKTLTYRKDSGKPTSRSLHKRQLLTSIASKRLDK